MAPIEMATMNRRDFLTTSAALAASSAWGSPADAPSALAKPPTGDWQSMFDGVSLRGWRETAFTRPGKVSVEKGTIVLGTGAMTGITWTNPFPRSNYEVRLEAVRLEGSDFFAGITFPVKNSYCSWINGGWGGSVVGLSSLNGLDASENESSTTMEFERGRWYRLRLRVTDEWIMAWIDDELCIEVALEGQEIGLRWGEIELSAPFGVATYATTGALRKLEYRLLEPPDTGAKRQ
jgi:hypothetical protein